ncbi:MAG: DNA polymerase III subunit delta' [Bernardetiaceae bacterium]|nr:DNA polymerase III subunit delta' [Bernardetiaceae bacterium]
MQFSDIIGLEKVKTTLVESYKQNHVAHAQLFVGNEGSANLALAWAYATYLNCQNKQAQDSCGSCASCVRMRKLVHPDMHFIFPAKKPVKTDKNLATREDFQKAWRSFLTETPYRNLSQWLHYLGLENKQLGISVEDSREIVKKLSLKPYEKGYKVMLMWLPEVMNIQSANALLKILEEPPGKTIFLLVSNNPQKLLITILSRCQQLRVPDFSDEQVKYYLKERGTEETRAAQIAAITEGNLIEAVRLSQDNSQDYQIWFRDWLRLCYKNQYAELIELAEAFHKLGKQEQKNLLQYGLTIFREAMISRFADPVLMRTDVTAKAFVEGFAKVVNERNLGALSKLFDEAYFHTERNANAKILFLDTSIQLSMLIR